MKTEAQAFINEMLVELRKEFFAGYGEKRFYQERSMLILAISQPADYMERRGANAGTGSYRKILQTVIDAIKAKGNRRKIKRFSAYFAHCVQEHMDHHGDEYYYEFKAARPIGQVLPGVVGEMSILRGPDPTTRILAEAHRAIRSPGGRRPRIQTAKQPGLFASCNAAAGAMQKPKNVLKPVADGPDSAISPQTSSAPRSDS